MQNNGGPFSDRALRDMIAPLLLEQLLMMLVGIADTFVISSAGEAAVSGVSLVNQFNTIFIYLFTALSSGGAVIISQYIGSRKYDSAGRSASQLPLFSTVFSAIVSVLVPRGNAPMLRLLFGRVEDDVMQACVTYLRISAYSFPALAVYNSGAAVCRSLGQTDRTMYISALANLVNVAGNLIGVYVLNAGVAGIAYPSLLARLFSAAAVTLLCLRKENPVAYRARWVFCRDRDLLQRILKIAVPNGVENGIFQLVKVALTSITALFGTYQIAANSVAQSIWSLAALAGVAGPVFITVIGQCMGSHDAEAADRYFKRLLHITFRLSAAWNLAAFLLTLVLPRFYALTLETKQLVIRLVLLHNLFNAAAFPLSGALSNGLRAAGDVKFTMYVSLASTICGRLLLSYLLGIRLSMGVMGVAAAMICDWSIRAAIFYRRWKPGKWKDFQII